MEWSYPELRGRLMKAGLWPQGKMARLACYLAGLAVALFLLEKLLGVFRPAWGAPLGGWITFFTFVACVLFFILGFRWVRWRILWRLRNRLIVTYLFIGAIPVVLLIAMGLITLYGLGGQFAVFVVTSEIDARLRSLEAVNGAVSNELAAHLERGDKSTPESLTGLRKRDSAWDRRQVCAWYGDKPLPLCSQFQGANLTPPAFSKAKFEDIVEDHDQLNLRVGSSMELGSNKLTVVTSEPFDKNLVGKIAVGLGEITLYSPVIKTDERPAGAGASGATTTKKSESGFVITEKPSSGGQKKQDAEMHPSFTVGAIPDPASGFDREITFATPLTVLTWPSGERAKFGPLLQVTTRPTVL